MSTSEKQPLLVALDTEQQLAYQQIAARETARRRRIARRIHFFVITVVLFTVFSWTQGFGIFSSVVSSIFPPFASPSRPSHPSDPADRVDVILSTPLDGRLELPDGLQCQKYNGAIKDYPVSSYSLIFDGEHSLSIRQNSTRHYAPSYRAPRDDDTNIHWRHVHVTGEVVVRKVAGDKKASIDVEAVSNDKRIRTAYSYVEKAQSLSIIVDDRIWAEARDDPAFGPGSPCLTVRATVWLPEAASNDKDAAVHLKSLYIGNTHLGVQLLDDVNLVVDETARLSSVIGSISSSRALSETRNADAAQYDFAEGYRFEAPEADIDTVASPINGPWALVNRLHIGSVSGPVNVAVAPIGAAPADDNEVAELRLSTVSGDIGFEEIHNDDAAHPHSLVVVSQSGTIHGSGSFARAAQLHTTSGNIVASLRPKALVENSEVAKATLDTNTVHGTTELFVLDEANGQPLDFLQSSHNAMAGTIELHYPASWAGNIHLRTTIGGALAIEGKGVRVLPDDKPQWPPISHKVDAVKDIKEGEKKTVSNVTAKTVSGSVGLSFPA